MLYTLKIKLQISSKMPTHQSFPLFSLSFFSLQIIQWLFSILVMNKICRATPTVCWTPWLLSWRIRSDVIHFFVYLHFLEYAHRTFYAASWFCKPYFFHSVARRYPILQLHGLMIIWVGWKMIILPVADITEIPKNRSAQRKVCREIKGRTVGL